MMTKNSNQNIRVLSEKVIRFCFGLHTQCQCMCGPAELADMCIHVLSGAALPGPAHWHVGPRAMPGTPSRHPRVFAASGRLHRAACGVVVVVGEEGRADSSAEKGFALTSQKCWRSIPTEPFDRSVRESDQILLGSAHADLKH